MSPRLAQIEVERQPAAEPFRFEPLTAPDPYDIADQLDRLAATLEREAAQLDRRAECGLAREETLHELELGLARRRKTYEALCRMSPDWWTLHLHEAADVLLRMPLCSGCGFPVRADLARQQDVATCFACSALAHQIRVLTASLECDCCHRVTPVSRMEKRGEEDVCAGCADWEANADCPQCVAISRAAADYERTAA